MTIELSLSPEDRLALYRDASTRGRVSYYAMLLGWAALGVTGGLILLFKVGLARPESYAVMALAIILIERELVQAWRGISLRRAYTTYDVAAENLDMTIDLDEGGIGVRTRFGASRYGKADLSGCARVRGGFIFYLAFGSFIAIPAANVDAEVERLARALCPGLKPTPRTK